MLDPELQRVAEARIAADRRESVGAFRKDVSNAVAELYARGVFRSSISIGRMSDLCVAETRRRAALAWQVLQATVHAADVRNSDQLAQDLHHFLESILPERPEDLLSVVRGHVGASGFPEMISDVENSIRAATLLAREKLGAETDIFVMSLKHGQQRTASPVERLETDGLTGLYRKEVFEKRGPELIDEAKRNGVPLSLLMMDIDHFKSVNDEHGHPAGDEAIKVVSGILKVAVGGKGEGYRWGGDELAAFLPNYTPEEAATLGERVRREVESTILSKTGIKRTVSIGVAVFPDHGHDHLGLHGAADKALYDAKNLGRNLVRLHGEPPPEAPGPREPKRRVPDSGDLTEEAKTKVREAYFKTRIAHCPKDGAILKVVEAPRIFGQRSVHILASCPLCGMDINLPGADR